MPTPYITKGTRIRAHWFQPKPLGTYSLAGVQYKVTGTYVDVAGVCKHFRGDDPINPTQVQIYIEVDQLSMTPEQEKEYGLVRERPYGCTCDGHENLLRINPDHIVGVE